MFVIDEHRNARIAERKGIDPASDEFHLKYSYRFTQAQNDAVLALHAMETAAYSLGLGCVILGSLLNNIPGLIDVPNLPEYTYPVLGLAIGKPDQNPTVRWTASAIRSPRSVGRMSAIRRCSTRPPLRASVWISETRTNEKGSDGLVTESSQSQHCDDSVPTPQHFITGYRQNCTTIPPVSHYQ